MDFSQYIRLKNEAANKYMSRTKTVDSSFLTLQRRDKAVYSGFNNIQAIPYFKGSPVVNSVLYDLSSCPLDHKYTQGHTTVNRQSQQESIAMRNSGGVICNAVDYSTASPGFDRINRAEQSTILTQYDNLTPAPGIWKPYGYGQNHYFPKPETCPTPYTPALWPLN